jgi:mono/diheme cytochrome c family protein
VTRKLLVGTFTGEEALLAAAEAARRSGAEIVDAFTPYPVHGLDEAMGIEPSRLPIYCFAFGLGGTIVALMFQLWTSAFDWALDVGGKPLLSLPAFVPVAFEMTILVAGVGVFFAMFMGSGLFPGKLPAAQAPRVTRDSFVLVLRGEPVGEGESDPREVLRAHGGVVSEVDEARTADETGSLTVLRLLAISALVAAAIALVSVEVARVVLAGSKDRRNYVALPDMVDSVPYDAFDANPNFPDGLTLRAPVPGTVARGFLPIPRREVPNPVADTPEAIERGRRVFTIYCAPCHGESGKGDGVVPAHGGVPPPSLMTESVRNKKDRILFAVISNGLGNMAGYGAQLEREDRWKVIRYVRTLKEKP